MKKVIGILATALILSGCGSSSDNHEIKKTSFMKEGKNSLYALYNTRGVIPKICIRHIHLLKVDI